jgi:predicted anti-sigma-YlaC factor YlaD
VRCEELDRVLDSVLDGECTPSVRMEVKDHLDACARCRARHGPLLAWLDELARNPRVPLPDRLSAPPERATRARLRRLTLRPVAAAAAVLLVVAGALILRTLFVAGPDRTLETIPAGEKPAGTRTVLGTLCPVAPLHLVRRDIHEQHFPFVHIRSEVRVVIAPSDLGLDNLEPENHQP